MTELTLVLGPILVLGAIALGFALGWEWDKRSLEAARRRVALERAQLAEQRHRAVEARIRHNRQQ